MRRGAQRPARHVVRERRPRPVGARGRCPAGPASGWSSSRRPSAAATSSGRSGRRTTNPVSPSTTASAAPPLSPRDLGHAARGGLEEHDAEALLLEAGPAVAARHGEHVARTRTARAGRRRAPGRGTAPAPAGAAASRSRRPPVAAAARDRDLEAGVGDGQARRGLDEHVESLARHQPADAHHEQAVDGEPQRARARCGASVGIEGPEALDVDARRHDRRAAARARRRVAPRRAG